MDDRKIPEYQYSPASQPPENLLNPTYGRSFPTETHPLNNPLLIKLHSSDQALESAFSRLTLSPDFQPHAETPSFRGLQAAINGMASAESAPSPLGGNQQQALLWAQSQNNSCGVSGPFGFIGAHQNINVGPGRGPYIDEYDHPLSLMMMKHHLHDQRQHLCDGFCGNYECSSLHGKKPLSTKAYNNFPILPFAHQSNFCSLASMRGRIVSLAKDKVWSDILIFKIEKGLIDEEIEMVLSEVIEFLDDLMRNQFGSYFIQKLFGICNEEQRTKIIMALTKFPFKLINTCLNSYGARVVPKLLEKLITPQQISFIVSALSLGASALATDPNGHHVIQYCVRRFSGEYNKNLFSEIANNCFKIATNKSGCCVLQLCVESSNGEARKRLISEIITNALHLAEHPYGNYVVQHLLGLRMQEVTANLVRRFQGHFASLSFNKYASNVVEKFISESGENQSATIIMELLTSQNAPMLLLDPFGNFVIQSALSASKGDVHDALLNLIQVHAPFMQSNLYGKKILAWFEKRKLNIV
ncbi:hypothetical protein BUALT_Bualt08G0040500 [Buddleja alternifolia]|uniref:PUM-HD domain-containing protein n=1 Tax=Buddleja alternifolia TaxID=168488 RepID=A0AAV6X3X8_9LAMI|nr:hypothetical protein BUALT_Bualt08G0040500 [Buddleja alternifolia]